MQNLERTSKVLKALSSEQRLEIVRELLESDGFRCYCELTDVVDRDMSVVYRHFKKLERAGILETEKKGKRLEGRIRNSEKIRKLLETAGEVSESED